MQRQQATECESGHHQSDGIDGFWVFSEKQPPRSPTQSRQHHQLIHAALATTEFVTDFFTFIAMNACHLGFDSRYACCLDNNTSQDIGSR